MDALDPDYVDDLMLQKLARADHALLSQDSKDNRELMRQQAARRRELMDWRETVKRGK